jgi:hypothetical protein
MKRYCFVFLIFLCGCMEVLKAQPRRYVARTFYFDLITFQHAAGMSIYGSPDAANWGMTYSPRANLIMLGDNTISVGTHLGVGVTGKGPGGIKLIYDIPFVFDFNIAHKALIDNNQAIGGFFGLGYGFSRLQADFGSTKSQGLVFNGGIRGRVTERSFTLRVSYMLPLKSERKSVYSVGIMKNF